VGDAMKELAKERILSAPVTLNASVEDDDGGQYIGMLDVSSILHHFIRDYTDHSDSRIQLQHEKAAKFFSSKLITVVGEDVSMVHKMETRTSLHDLLRNGFFKGAKAVHRVCLFNERGVITAVISQSDVIKFLHEHLRLLGELGAKTVAELGLGLPMDSSDGNRVVTVRSDASALNAFHTLYTHGVHGIGVVDAQNGKLLANLSASDLRGVTRDELDLLDANVLRFLQIEQAHLSNRLRPITAYSVRRSYSLADVLDAFVTARVHRVFVVDEDEAPEGVITLTDILNLVRQG